MCMCAVENEGLACCSEEGVKNVKWGGRRFRLCFKKRKRTVYDSAHNKGVW